MPGTHRAPRRMRVPAAIAAAVVVAGVNAVAMAVGNKSKARAPLDSWLVLGEWEQNDNLDWNIKEIKTAKVDGKKIKADTWYKLENGRFVRDK